MEHMWKTSMDMETGVGLLLLGIDFHQEPTSKLGIPISLPFQICTFMIWRFDCFHALRADI